MTDKLTFSKNDTQIAKAIAIIMMMFHHCFLDETRFAGYVINFSPFSQDVVVYVSAFFKICVGIFVFITAYGITITAKKKNQELNISQKDAMYLVIPRYIKLMTGFWFIYVLVNIYSYILNLGHFSNTYGTGKKAYAYCLIDALGLSHLLNTPTENGTWWYMSLAIVLIVIMPCMIMLYKRLGAVSVIMAFILPYALNMPYSDLLRWLGAVMFGIWFADKNILYKVKKISVCKSTVLNKFIKFIIATVILRVLIFCRQNEIIGEPYLIIWDSLVPVFWVYYIYEFISDIKGLNTVLIFIGKQSMNIFLVHTFIRFYWYKDFIYGFKQFALIAAILFAISLVISIIIEIIKKIIKYDNLIDYINSKVIKLIYKDIENG